MTVDKSIVDEQIKALGNVDSYGTKKEIKYLPEIMMPDETILGLCSGMMDNNTWLCAITDKRVIMLDKGMITGLKQLEIPISQIKSVSFKTGIIFGELLVDSGGQIKKLEKMLKTDAPKMASILTDLLHNKGTQHSQATASPNSSASTDIVTQLERLATLKEKGILNEEEFKVQKNKILGM